MRKNVQWFFVWNSCVKLLFAAIKLGDEHIKYKNYPQNSVCISDERCEEKLKKQQYANETYQYPSFFWSDDLLQKEVG